MNVRITPADEGIMTARPWLVTESRPDGSISYLATILEITEDQAEWVCQLAFAGNPGDAARFLDVDPQTGEWALMWDEIQLTTFGPKSSLAR